MKQRGRRSSKQLAVVDSITAVQRLAPPSRLTAEEREVWLMTVNAKPADWFTLDQGVLLESYCRHVCTGRVMVHVRDQVMAQWQEGACKLSEFERACRMCERESRAIGSLATRMRLTPQSVIDKRVAGIRGERHVEHNDKPWLAN